jgi:hypothetical protein
MNSISWPKYTLCTSGQRQNIWNNLLHGTCTGVDRVHQQFLCSVYLLWLWLMCSSSAVLTKEPWQFLPSDLAAILQHSSGPSPDFPAKTLGVNAEQFLCIIQFYLPVSSLWACRSHYSAVRYVIRNTSVGGTLDYIVGNLGSISTTHTFL